MPGSYRHFDALIGDRISLDFPRDTQILDVGAGSGKYRDILHDFPDIDAIEPHSPYIERFELHNRYRRVFDCSAQHISPYQPSWYDLVIMGDVLEHMTVEDARQFLYLCASSRTAVLVAVPYLYEQEDYDGVEWERHIQSDLTHEVFIERYGDFGFECLVRDDKYGIYVWDPLSRWATDEIPENPHVSLVIPTYEWNVKTQCLVSCWKTQAYHIFNRLCPLTLQPNNGGSIEKSRNRGVAMNMAQKGITHLCFIDSDQGWHEQTIQQLLSHAVQVIGVPIRQKSHQLQWNMSGLPGTGHTIWNGRILEVGRIGSGFLLINRSCLARMISAYPELAVEDEQLGTYHTLFQTDKLSEDYTFCERWRAIGGRIWADPTLEICHVGQAEFTGRYADHMVFADEQIQRGESQC